MSENISRDEINEFLEDLQTAQNDGSAFGFLRKGRDATQNISKLGESAVDSVGTLGFRAIYHADRLLEQGRSDIERDFALALADNAKKVMGSMSRGDKCLVCATISGEGSDCCLWWTLSPYVFDQLKPKVGENEALRRLLEWAKTGRPCGIEGKKVNLSGLGVYNYIGPAKCTFTLSKDPRGMSHQFAKQEAQRLVKEVFST